MLHKMRWQQFYIPYFGQDLGSNKKAVGILAHVWLKMPQKNLLVGTHYHRGIPALMSFLRLLAQMSSPDNFK